MPENNSSRNVEDSDVNHRWVKAQSLFDAGDYGAALHIFKSLVSDGEWPALSEVGHILELGYADQSPNYVEAANWYRKAIYEADDPNAHLCLGRLYLQGHGVQKDYQLALNHLRKAALSGNPIAALTLGILFHTGEGVIKNEEEARKWYKSAGDQGYVAAIQHLGALELECGHVFKSFILALRVKVMFLKIALRDRNDPRLYGIVS